MSAFTKNILVMIGLLVSSVALQAEPRTWKNTSGKEIQAELLRVDGDKVRLQLTANRKVFILPIASLSAEDQTYIKEYQESTMKTDQKTLLSNRKAKWTEDWDKAQKEAKETGLPILLFMTGSDWCGYCMQLKETVFEQSAFKRFANKNLILMTVDFPRGSQKKSLQKQNAKLKQQYPVGGFPTVYLLDSKLDKLGKFSGYGGDSMKEYIAKLESKLAK